MFVIAEPKFRREHGGLVGITTATGLPARKASSEPEEGKTLQERDSRGWACSAEEEMDGVAVSLICSSQ